MKTRQLTTQIQALLQLTDDYRVITIEIDHEYENATKSKVYVKNHEFDAIELPWRNNKRNISRIPRGVYAYSKIFRASNSKPAIWLRDVKDRSEILIHQGTKPEHSKGCIVMPEYNKLHEIMQEKGFIVLLNKN